MVLFEEYPLCYRNSKGAFKKTSTVEDEENDKDKPEEGDKEENGQSKNGRKRVYGLRQTEHK